MWYWRCTYEKGGCFDADYECCRAYCKKGFKTKELAEKASKSHRCRYRSEIHVWYQRGKLKR